MKEQGATEACEAKRGPVLSRRSFGALAGVGSAAMGLILAVPVLRYVLYPIYSKSTESEWSDVGDAAGFAAGGAPVKKTITFAQRDGWREIVSTRTVYVTRDKGGELVVLSAICPHLGCSVAWQAGREKFVCPCHGGVFQADGLHVLGPPPRAMDRLPAQVKDGKLQVQFQYFRSNVPNQEKIS